MDVNAGAVVFAAAGMPSARRKGGEEMSYLEKLKENANDTRTLNGAKTHRSSGDACLDLFAVAGGMRYRRSGDQIRLFDRAYIENPELAMKLLFHLRDIREGMGERKLFRTLIRHVAFTWPESARKNVVYISEFGRWDDLMCLLGSPAKKQVVQTIKAQLAEDEAALKRRKAGEDNAHISLLAKWLPSDNTSSYRTRRTAKYLIDELGMDQKEYRRLVTALRARIGLTECQLTKKQVEKINYEAVPAQAMLKYREAFECHDKERFSEYLLEAAFDEKRIHTGTLFPYEVLRPYFKRRIYSSCSAEGSETLEQLWNHLPGTVGNVNSISVVDTSGSMYFGKGALTPALVSQAMGLYCAERCQGVFHNHLITFESEPHLVEVHGSSLQDRLRYIRTLPWGGSTNLEAVFDLILNTAVNSCAAQEEMPQVLYIFSDMEFNCCMRNADKTVYENARELFEAYGYQMPAVVFHNVNSWQMQTPVTAKTRGTALSSGASTHTLSHKFDGNITPMNHMLRVLNSERYEMIHA